MQVVDGVAPVVLDVPAEGREAHAHVEPGQLHAADVPADVRQHRLLQHRHVVQVPARARVLLCTPHHHRTRRPVIPRVKLVVFLA